MTKLKKIDPLSAAKIEGLIGVVFGLIAGIFMFIAGAGIRGMMGAYGGGYGYGSMMAGFGIGAIIVMPIMYGICGFIAGAIVAWVYNLAAGWIGGIEIELENK
jgi:hypothetical protein